MPNPRQDFIDALNKQVEPNIVSHSIALEACMGGIYDFLKTQGKLNDDEPGRDEWSLAGLIHDIDYGGEWKDQHPQKTSEALEKYNLEVSAPVMRIVKAHAPSLTGVQPSNKAEWSIFCADSLTGLISAVALIYPSKKLSEVKPSSILKRFLKEPKFAAGTRRDEVALCARPDGLDIPIEKFIEICLAAMQGVANDIGL